MSDEMGQGPFIFNDQMRRVVDGAIRELCGRRGYGLKALNVRTNHAHVVLSAAQKPERIVDALKANATKALREIGLISVDTKVWSRGRSRRYLWKPRHISAAIEYTLYGQGDFEMPE
jgi:REP element-mobilizing transposase RayT